MSGDRRDEFEAEAFPHATALYRAALRSQRNPDDAADVVQETFLRAFRTFGSFVPGTSAKAWLFTILYSVVSNRAPFHIHVLGPEIQGLRQHSQPGFLVSVETPTLPHRPARDDGRTLPSA